MRRLRKTAMAAMALAFGVGGFWLACEVLATVSGDCRLAPVAQAWSAPRLGAAPDRPARPEDPAPQVEEPSVPATPPPPAQPTRTPRRRSPVALAGVLPANPVEVPLDPEFALRSALRLAQPAFELCYQSALKTDQRVKGRLVVELNLEASGTVTAARIVESTLRDDAVSVCITRKLRSMRLPTLTEDAQVTVPMTLVPRPG